MFCVLESQVAYEGDPVDLHCDNTYIPLEGETPVTEYLTSWFKLTDSRTDEDKTLIARHTGQRNVHIAEKYDGRGLELYLRDGRLTIPEIQVGDEGRYLCTGAYREPQETELVVKGREAKIHWNPKILYVHDFLHLLHLK